MMIAKKPTRPVVCLCLARGRTRPQPRHRSYSEHHLPPAPRRLGISSSNSVSQRASPAPPRASSHLLSREPIGPPRAQNAPFRPSEQRAPWRAGRGRPDLDASSGWGDGGHAAGPAASAKSDAWRRAQYDPSKAFGAPARPATLPIPARDPTRPLVQYTAKPPTQYPTRTPARDIPPSNRLEEELLRAIQPARPRDRPVQNNQEWGLLTRHSRQAPPLRPERQFFGGRRQPEPPGRPALDFFAPIEKRPPPPNRGRREFWQEVNNRLQSQHADAQRPPANRGGFDAQPTGRVAGLSLKPESSPASWAWLDEGKEPPLPVTHDSSSFSRRTAERKKERRDKPAKAKSSSKRRPYSSRGRDDDEDIDEATADLIEERRRRKEERKRLEALELAAKENVPTPIMLPELISVSNLGLALGMKPTPFLEQLAELGFEDIGPDSIMTGETAALVAQEYGFEPTVDKGELVDLRARPPPDDPTALPPRPPIVTIMGHVDHGKTTMLDWLRKSALVAQEHGGITQHIGAFVVKLSSGKHITFLDTPGHAAFLTMRQRGANVTDIVVLVVAADDSVKPQTLEALNHARAANVPIIVAINKVDKEAAHIEQVKADLSRHGVELEDHGGDVQVVSVSGKTGQGMDDLEENIVTLSEILDVRAEPDGMVEGWVLESSIKPIGRVATILVKRGTLRRGDIIVAGTTWARVRMLRNEAGVEVDEAAPGTPVEVLGWKDAPAAGDDVIQGPDESSAKAAVHYRVDIMLREKTATEIAVQERKVREKLELEEARKESTATTTEAKSEDDAEGGVKTLNLTVKGDVTGSVEAVCAAIMEVGNNEVRPRILRYGPGQIIESDVEHAATTGSSIINFNNPIRGMIKRQAEDSAVEILDHSVIYRLVADIKSRLTEMLPPRISTKVVGEAEVLQVFAINVKGRHYKNIAGCRIRNGQVTKAGKYRVFRNGETVFDGTLESLKHGKKDVAEMRKGAECGMSFEGWQDVREGDKIQEYEEVRETRHL